MLLPLNNTCWVIMFFELSCSYIWTPKIENILKIFKNRKPKHAWLRIEMSLTSNFKYDSNLGSLTVSFGFQSGCCVINFKFVWCHFFVDPLVTHTDTHRQFLLKTLSQTFWSNKKWCVLLILSLNRNPKIIKISSWFKNTIHCYIWF